MIGRDLNDRGYCGVNCSVCPDFTEGKCPGCRKSTWTEENICMPVKCCREKGISVCGECSEFPCADMKEFYTESEGHDEAYRFLKEKFI